MTRNVEYFAGKGDSNSSAGWKVSSINIWEPNKLLTIWHIFVFLFGHSIFEQTLLTANLVGLFESNWPSATTHGLPWKEWSFLVGGFSRHSKWSRANPSTLVVDWQQTIRRRKASWRHRRELFFDPLTRGTPVVGCALDTFSARLKQSPFMLSCRSHGSFLLEIARLRLAYR